MWVSLKADVNADLKKIHHRVHRGYRGRTEKSRRRGQLNE